MTTDYPVFPATIDKPRGTDTIDRVGPKLLSHFDFRPFQALSRPQHTEAVSHVDAT